jgi:hypothetical protein
MVNSDDVQQYIVGLYYLYTIDTYLCLSSKVIVLMVNSDDVQQYIVGLYYLYTIDTYLCLSSKVSVLLSTKMISRLSEQQVKLMRNPVLGSQ